jgi:hypothetical protein
MPLDVFVTANMQGDLDMLPRLYTAIRRARELVPNTALLIDTGRAWSAESWVCTATENRAPYFALDAMGYDAAFADGLSLAEFDKLRGELQMQLLASEAQFDYALNGVNLSFGVATNTDAASMQSGLVRVPMPTRGLILHMTLDAQTITQQTVLRLTDAHLPDPTIAGAVEFIVSEARYYQKKREHES